MGHMPADRVQAHKATLMNDDVRREIGRRLGSARRAVGLSQQDVAESVKVRRQAVSAWERGKSMPTLAEWYELGPLYGASLDFLVYGLRTVPVGSSPSVSAILRSGGACSPAGYRLPVRTLP
jgi:transcriptional regulator with XRE-family HTH domain